MLLSDAGKLVERSWTNLAERFPSVEPGAFVVMPNHIHGIIRIVRHRGAASSPLRNGGAASTAPPLGQIVRAFKSTSARAGNRLLSRVAAPLWQRNYVERVIRNDDELGKIREYSSTNPVRWASDRENPEASACDGEPWEQPPRAPT
jgi:putative transposase